MLNSAVRSLVPRLLVALGAVGVILLATPAYAGGPTRITVTGPGLFQPLVIDSDIDDTLFSSWSNVIYRAGLEIGYRRQPLGTGPADPGPQYIMVVDYHDVPTYRYELYPQATGGPHIYVPAEQPRPEFEPPGEAGWYASDDQMVTLLTRAIAPARIPTTTTAAVASSPVASSRGVTTIRLVLLGAGSAAALFGALMVIGRQRHRSPIPR